ncbi:MAG: hypothetical protein AB1603_06140 [Chloroflexota bacterium]
MSTSARKELAELVGSTEVMRQVLQDLEEETLRLLCAVYKEYQKTSKAVPDHRLPLYNYFAEAGLRALLAADLLKSSQENRYSLYEYELTEKGLELCRRLCDEGACGP